MARTTFPMALVAAVILATSAGGQARAQDARVAAGLAAGGILGALVAGAIIANQQNAAAQQAGPRRRGVRRVAPRTRVVQASRKRGGSGVTAISASSDPFAKPRAAEPIPVAAKP